MYNIQISVLQGPICAHSILYDDQKSLCAYWILNRVAKNLYSEKLISAGEL